MLLLVDNSSSGAELQMVVVAGGKMFGVRSEDLGSVTRLHQHLIMEMILLLLPDTTRHHQPLGNKLPAHSLLENLVRRLNNGCRVLSSTIVLSIML